MPNIENGGTTASTGFTESFRALDEILEQLRKGAPTLEESLQLFEQGVQHIRVCQDRLSKARGRVEELVQTLHSGGEIVTRPFEDE
jgi:exodeoxyribonuclease VII small subunit